MEFSITIRKCDTQHNDMRVHADCCYQVQYAGCHYSECYGAEFYYRTLNRSSLQQIYHEIFNLAWFQLKIKRSRFENALAYCQFFYFLLGLAQKCCNLPLRKSAGLILVIGLLLVTTLLGSNSQNFLRNSYARLTKFLKNL